MVKNIHFIVVGKESNALHLAGVPRLGAEEVVLFDCLKTKKAENISRSLEAIGVQNRTVPIEKEYIDAYRNASEEAKLADASMGLQGTGSIPVKFHLDGNGNYHFEASKYGAGKTVHCTAWVDSPDATYNVTVKSSDGGGGTWSGLKVKQQVHFDLHTSFWHNTKITVDIHGSVTNVDGKAEIQYKY